EKAFAFVLLMRVGMQRSRSFPLRAARARTAAIPPATRREAAFGQRAAARLRVAGMRAQRPSVCDGRGSTTQVSRRASARLRAGKGAKKRPPTVMSTVSKMARPERFELPTAWFVARYSIQLSYGRVVEARNYACVREVRQYLF